MKMAEQYGDNVSNRNEQFKNEYERKMRSCKVPSRIVLVFLLIYIAYYILLIFLLDHIVVIGFSMILFCL